LFANGLEIFQPVDSVSSKNKDKICCRLERYPDWKHASADHIKLHHNGC